MPLGAWIRQGANIPVMLYITAGGLDFVARLEEEDAPQTVAAFRRLLPLESRIIHVRWSGEAAGSRWATSTSALGPENATRYPARASDPLTRAASARPRCSAVRLRRFASKAGALAGNHFATIVEGDEQLRELGRRMLWEGAQEISFTER